MNKQILGTGVLAVALFGCQNEEYTHPDEGNTGTAPRDDSAVYQFDSTRAPAYLDANLQSTNAVRAVFLNTEAGITPFPVNGVVPEFAGSEANLLAGVGFGTYANPDYRVPVAWADAGDFKSVVSATVSLSGPGDSVLLCRSFATTCVEIVSCDGDLCPSGVYVAIVRLAANAPNTEIGPIAAGVSAAIRGTGESGLTIAITDEATVGLPFLATDGTAFDVEWSIARGEIENSIDWSVSIGGSEIGSGNSAVDLAGAITKTGGVGLVFDQEFGSGGFPSVSYEYVFDGEYFSDSFNDIDIAGPTPPFPDGITLSPQPGLGYAPLFVYPTEDDGHIYGTMSGDEGAPHGVQLTDGILGLAVDPPGSTSQRFVYSVAFNGDDFDTTAGADPFEGLVDWGGDGGGFYPSPSFCYSQIVPAVDAKVRAGVRKELHRKMYAGIGAALGQADGMFPPTAGLAGIAAGINGNVTLHGIVGHDLVYAASGTGVTGYTDAEIIAVATDFADSNVDTASETSAEDVYTVEQTATVGVNFKTQLADIYAALSIDVDPSGGVVLLYTQLGGAVSDSAYAGFGKLLAGLTGQFGVMDGVNPGTTPDAALFDEYPPFDAAECLGIECNVAWLTQEIAVGSNDSLKNASGGMAALASTCLWGAPPTAAVAASDAVLVLDADPGNDGTNHPAYAAVAAAALTPPVRETAAGSMNTLVQGIYGNFIGAVFGPGVPASNFSLAMGTAAGNTGPALTSLTITNGAAPAEE